MDRISYYRRNTTRLLAYIDEGRAEAPDHETRTFESIVNRRLLVLDDLMFVQQIIRHAQQVGLYGVDELRRSRPKCYHGKTYWSRYSQGCT